MTPKKTPQKKDPVKSKQRKSKKKRKRKRHAPLCMTPKPKLSKDMEAVNEKSALARKRYRADICKNLADDGDSKRDQKFIEALCKSAAWTQEEANDTYDLEGL